MLDPKNIIRSPRRTLSLFLTPAGELIVKAPLKLPEHKIYEFVKSKSDWISARQRQILQNSYINRSVLTYSTFMLLGQELTPVISNTAKQITKQDNMLLIPAKIAPDAILKRVEKWMKTQAAAILAERAGYFSQRLNLRAVSVETNNNRSRWGSCDSKRRINLNWRAVMLPPNLFDYIIVHEYCHLLEFNHTRNFWAIVATILPDWKALRKHLKQMGWLLHLFRPK